MSSNEMPVEQARKVLGDLVANAQLAGVTTIITRYGRPAALITPIPQETSMITEQQKQDARDLGAQMAKQAVEERWPDREAIAAARLAPFRAALSHRQLAERFGVSEIEFAMYLEPHYLPAFVFGVDQAVTAMENAPTKADGYREV